MINLADTLDRLGSRLGQSTAPSPAFDPARRHVVGVHLDHDALRWIEWQHGRIAAWKHLPYPPGMQIDSDTFTDFLRTAFAACPDDLPVWLVSSFPSLQLRFLSLPKVRPGQLSNLVYWTYRKELPFEPDQTILDYDVEGEVATPGANRKIDVTAFTVARAEVERLVLRFSEAGRPVEGVIIPSTALRNLLRTHPGQDARIGLFVGEDASSILFAQGPVIVSQRLFKTGMNSLRTGTTDDPTAAYQSINSALTQTAHGEQTAAAMEATEANRISRSALASFSRLIQQVERSIAAYVNGRATADLRGIHVAGSLAGMPLLLKEMSTKLGIPAQPFAAAEAGITASSRPAMSPIEFGQMGLAIGAALSQPGRTPNALHTYVKREQEDRRRRAQSWVGLSAIGGLLLLLLIFLFAVNHNAALRRERTALSKQMEPYKPHPDRAMIQNLVGLASGHTTELRDMARRAQPLALINEIATLTPSDIRLGSVALERTAAPVRTRKNPAAAQAGDMKLTVQGMVLGETELLESVLAQYILRLQRSSLFAKANLTRSEPGRDGSNPVWLFTLELDAAPIAPPPPLTAAPAQPAGGAR